MRFCLHGVRSCCRYYSQTTSKSLLEDTNEALKAKSYGHTLLLPKTNFPLRTVGAKREIVYRRKTTEDLYKWQVRILSGLHFIA